MAKNNEQEEKTAMDEVMRQVKLKKRMKDVPDDELYGGDNLFYRFLKARDFNVDSAEIMLKEHLEWRKKYDVKNFSKYKHPEVLEKYFSLNKLGHDKEGAVIHYVPSGSIDWIGLNSSCKIDELGKCVIQYFEKDLEDLREYSKKVGKTVDKLNYICNMENFSFAQATDKKVLSSFIFLTNLYQNNYPETLKIIAIIKASPYFYLLFSVLKNFMPLSVVNKFKIYGDDSWKEDFLKTIDAEVLPEFLGGKRTDPDGNPLCLTCINHGGIVPQEYYIHRSKRSLASLPDVQQLTLSRADFHEVFLEVKEADSYLEWEFETESRDIGFGLFYEDIEGNKTEIVPLQRINTDEYAETGIYKCENVGTYIVIFDNTYSIIRKKDIYYRIKILKPDEGESHIMN